MTFIVTAVSVECVHAPRLPKGPLLLEPVARDTRAWARAGYLPGLTRHLGTDVNGFACHILVKETSDWATSDPLFAYSDDDDEPAHLSVGESFRGQLDSTLSSLIEASPVGKGILVCEYNGGVTSPDLDDTAVEAVDVIGPLRLVEFWKVHDLGEIVEDSVVQLVG